MLKHRLPNGTRVAAQEMPGFSSVSMGVWINAGSVYEDEGESGAAHFIEHMLFKGTRTRSAAVIAEEMDAVGGNLNAFTGKECTCFYGRVLRRDAAVLTDILSDLVCNASLAPEDIEREKGVVLEEISMTEDTPEDLVNELATAAFYEGDPLAKPILGTAGSVRSFTREKLVSYMGRLYRPEDMVISVAGSFSESELIPMLEDKFSAFGERSVPRTPFGKHIPGRRFAAAVKDIEQAHICVCLPGFRKDTPESYAQLVFSNAFGGSMSSRLFQKIREEKGLAYSVYAYPTTYADSGFVTLYAGTGPENAAEVSRLMREELSAALSEGVSEAELERSKQQLISSFLMSRESTVSRCSALGRAELMNGRILTEAEVIANIEAVTRESILSVLPVICSEEDVSAAVVGRISGQEDELRRILLCE